MLAHTAVLALSVSAVLGSPVLERRQASSTSAGSSASGAGTTVAVSSAASSVVSSAASAISSVVSSASAANSTAPSSTASSAAPTATGAATPGLPLNYTGCPANYSLTYVLGIAPFPDVNITRAYQVLSNWSYAIPPPLVRVNGTSGMNMTSMGNSTMGNSTMSNMTTGALGTRAYRLQNVTVSEMLTNQTGMASTGSLMQMWTQTSPVTAAPSVVVSNATSALNLYTNSTSNATTVQLYVNFCVSDQQAGLQLYGQLVQLYLSGLSTLFNNASLVGSSTSAASSSAASATSAIANATSTAAASATSAASVASSGASSVASAASSAVSSVVSAATGAVVSAVVSPVASAATRA